MTQHDLSSLARKMAGITVAQFATHTGGGQMSVRPMSNNGEVEYDGTSYYFADGDSKVVADLRREHHVALSFQSADGLYVAVQGRATLSRDRDALAAHWRADLDQWFGQGIETPGLTLIQVDARQIRYWDTSGEAFDQGQIDL